MVGTITLHLGDITTEQFDENCMENATREAVQRLDPYSGRVIEAVYFAADDERRLLVVIHHLSVDGVSWRIILEDIQTAYDQLQHGTAISLPPKTTSFQRWAERLADYAQSEALQQELTYWLAPARRRRHPAGRVPRDRSAVRCHRRT